MIDLEKSIDLERLEVELKKRVELPYIWGKPQFDNWDKITNFIYETHTFSDLKKRTISLSDDIKNYAFNRWLNFWSAKGVEQIFTSQENVIANKNKYDKLVDFKINNIPFDHKTSIFPQGFKKDFRYALDNNKELIQWLYENQSQEGRKHFENRLFIILFNKSGKEHWKLKAEIIFIKQYIEEYIKNFSENKLEKINFNNKEVLSDIIWIIK